MNNLNVDTGDLILVEGCGFNSKLIQIFTESKISHAGIVWKCPITNLTYVWETGDLNNKSFPIITKRDSALNSAHLILLEKKFIPGVYHKVYVRKLIGPKAEFRCHILTLKVCSYFRENQLAFDVLIAEKMGKPYLSNLVSLWTQRGDLMREGVYLNVGVTPSLIDLGFIHDNTEFADSPEQDEWMCSQLALMTYHQLGIVRYFDGPTHTVTPGDMFDDVVTTPGYEFESAKLLWSE